MNNLKEAVKGCAQTTGTFLLLLEDSLAFVTRAFLYGDGTGYFQILREFLYRVGLRETQTIKDVSELTDVVKDNVWPLIFVDGQNSEVNDSFFCFDSLYSNLGLELFPYILVGNGEDRRFALSAISAGAKGFIKKPLQPSEAMQLVKLHIPKPNDPLIETAIKSSGYLLENDFEKAQNTLLQLAENVVFQRSSEIALLRIETLSGQFSLAEERITRVLKKYPNDLRVLCEIVDYYYHTHQYANASLFLNKIEAHKVLLHRHWQHFCLCVDTDDLDSAACLLADLAKYPAYKEVTIEAIARMMLFLGLGQYVPSIIKAFPNIAKSYASFVRIKKD